MKKTILFITLCLFFLILTTGNTYSDETKKGFINLIQDTNKKTKNKMIGKIYIYGDNAFPYSFGTCEGYFILTQFYKPNYFIFSYTPTKQVCRNILEKGTLIIMKVPDDMFKKARKDPSLIGWLKIYNISWVNILKINWDMDNLSKETFNRKYIVKNIIETTKTNGSISIAPIIEHWAINATPNQLKKYKKELLLWQENHQKAKTKKMKMKKEIAESFTLKGKKYIRYKNEKEWFCTHCKIRLVSPLDARFHKCKK